jgi:hypothetical protein
MADPSLLPLPVPEVRRLVWSLVWPPPVKRGHILHWSLWRRWHQARAKEWHYRRRLTHPS